MRAAAFPEAPLGLECRGQEREPGSQRGGRSQRARASPRSAGRRGACLRRAGSWRRTQGWALRAGGGLWKQGSRCPRTPGTAAATRISDQNKRHAMAGIGRRGFLKTSTKPALQSEVADTLESWTLAAFCLNCELSVLGRHLQSLSEFARCLQAPDSQQFAGGHALALHSALLCPARVGTC